MIQELLTSGKNWLSPPKVARLTPDGPSRGTVAISYLAWPFFEDPQSAKMRGHTNAYEVVTMAEAFRARGFCVEICDWLESRYNPPADCQVAIDIHSNLERWNLPPQCHRILHATGAHWLVQNCQELRRLLSLRERKSRALNPVRLAAPSRAVEAADEITILGNKFTADSFAFSGKPITRIPISSAYEFEFPRLVEPETAHRSFLWIGSYGMVLKGLDLVLEAFAAMPELQLTVCGRPEKETDFYSLYRSELENTPNIHFQGWVDLSSEVFHELLLRHSAVVYPSASEGGAGSVIHSMHGGLVPICTAAASVDLGDFGVLITEDTPEGVRQACQTFAALSPEEIEARRRFAYQHVRSVHTREAFKRNYSRFVDGLLQRLPSSKTSK